MERMHAPAGVAALRTRRTCRAAAAPPRGASRPAARPPRPAGTRQRPYAAQHGRRPRGPAPGAITGAAARLAAAWAGLLVWRTTPRARAALSSAAPRARCAEPCSARAVLIAGLWSRLHRAAWRDASVHTAWLTEVAQRPGTSARVTLPFRRGRLPTSVHTAAHGLLTRAHGGVHIARMRGRMPRPGSRRRPRMCCCGRVWRARCVQHHRSYLPRACRKHRCRRFASDRECRVILSTEHLSRPCSARQRGLCSAHAARQTYSSERCVRSWQAWAPCGRSVTALTAQHLNTGWPSRPVPAEVCSVPGLVRSACAAIRTA